MPCIQRQENQQCLDAAGGNGVVAIETAVTVMETFYRRKHVNLQLGPGENWDPDEVV